MNKQLPRELVYQATALLISIVLVHLFYITTIRPNADALLAEEYERAQSGESFVQERSLYVVLRDYEQESCIILMFWALSIMGYKMKDALKQRSLLERDLINIPEGMNILPEDSRDFIRPIQALSTDEKESLLPKALASALHRFNSTHDVQDVSESVKAVCDSESDRLDSELSMIRYIAWAIPSIGFIGTVRGIGDALGQAYKAVEGDIAGVTTSLGVAFNSTFIALVISILLMFLMHQLQLIQERLVLDTKDYCDQRLIRHLQVRRS